MKEFLPRPGTRRTRRATLLSSAFAAAFMGLASPAGAAPPAPGTEANPGVPFPSIVSKPAASTAAGDTPLPLASQPMTMDQPRLDKDLEQARTQSEARLNALKLGDGVGDGKMTPPDVTSYQDELRRMQEVQRQSRLMAAEQDLADRSIKLWQTVHDPRREEDAADPARKAAVESKDEIASTAQTGTSPRPGPGPAPVVPVVAPVAAPPAPATVSAPRAEMPFPRISVLDGSPEHLNVMLLVPYVGEMPVRVGSVLPGGRHVVSISPDGVVVSDPRLGRVPLSYGDHVESVPVTSFAPSPVQASPSGGPPPMSAGNPGVIAPAASPPVIPGLAPAPPALNPVRQ